MRATPVVLVVLALMSGLPAEAAQDPGSGAPPTPSTLTPERWRSVDRRTIETYGLRSVADAVDLVAGFTTVRSYSVRNQPTVRGGLQPNFANRILVMIEGVPAWHATTGEGSLDRVSIESLERIDVWVGPGSVPFGSQAYGAVVNLVLRREAALHARAGAPGHYDAGMLFSAKQSAFSWLVTGNLGDIDGRKYPLTDETGEAGVISDFVRSANFTVNGTYKGAGAEHRLLVNAFRFDHPSLGPTLTFTQGMGHDRLNRGLLFSYGVTHALGTRARAEASLSYDSAYRDLSRSRDDNIRTDIEGTRVAAAAAATVDVSARSHVRLGVDFDNRRSVRYDSVDARADQVLEVNNMRNRSLWEGSVFGTYRYVKDRVSLGTGVRLIKNENFGAKAAFAGDVGYRWSNDHRLEARMAQAYRSPTVFELFFETPDRTVFGNLDLQPETGDQFELEYTGRFQDVTLRTVAYHARDDQQILRARRVPGSTTDRSQIYVNAAGAHSSGLEVEARYRIPAAGEGLRAGGAALTDLFVSYGLARGEDETAASGAPFRFAPDHSLTAGAARAFGPFVASTLVVYRSSTDGPLSPVTGQARVDLNLSYVHRYNGGELTHAISVFNLGNSALWFPEYIRQNINRIPYGFGRSISYVLRARLP